MHNTYDVIAWRLGLYEELCPLLYVLVKSIVSYYYEPIDFLTVHYRIQYGRSTGERPWLTIEDTVLEQTGALIGAVNNEKLEGLKFGEFGEPCYFHQTLFCQLQKSV